jgi:hypothetical protein
MPIIHLLQRIASLVPTHEVMLVVLLATTLVTALYARIRVPDGLKRHRLALGSVALGAATLLLAPNGVLPTPVIVGLLVAVTAGFVAHTITEARQADDDAAEEAPRKGALAVWVGVALAVLVLFLVADLGGYADALMVWEPESSMGLVEAHEANVPIHAFAAKRLLWDQGVVSAGHHSLLYGTGTYILWQLVGVSTTSLRLMSVLLAIACLPIAYMVGRETGSSRVATSAVVVMAINPIFIFYGRYGSSLAVADAVGFRTAEQSGRTADVDRPRGGRHRLPRHPRLLTGTSRDGGGGDDNHHYQSLQLATALTSTPRGLRSASGNISVVLVGSGGSRDGREFRFRKQRAAVQLCSRTGEGPFR